MIGFSASTVDSGDRHISCRAVASRRKGWHSRWSVPAMQIRGGSGPLWSLQWCQHILYNMHCQNAFARAFASYWSIFQSLNIIFAMTLICHKDLDRFLFQTRRTEGARITHTARSSSWEALQKPREILCRHIYTSWYWWYSWSFGRLLWMWKHSSPLYSDPSSAMVPSHSITASDSCYLSITALLSHSVSSSWHFSVWILYLLGTAH